jgi:hypothetical protein
MRGAAQRGGRTRDSEWDVQTLQVTDGAIVEISTQRWFPLKSDRILREQYRRADADKKG